MHIRTIPVAKYPYPYPCPFKQGNYYPYPSKLRISAKYLSADTYPRISDYLIFLVTIVIVQVTSWTDIQNSCIQNIIIYWLLFVIEKYFYVCFSIMSCGDGPYFIGVDVGSSSVRAALVTSGGHLVCLASSSIMVWEPETDYYEQSSDNIWNACCTVVRVRSLHIGVRLGGSAMLAQRIRSTGFLCGWPVALTVPDSLRDPDLGRDGFRRLLKTHLFTL